MSEATTGLHAATTIARLVEQGRSVIVLGEAGSGKTASAGTAVQLAGRNPHVAQCSASLAWLPFAPFDRMACTDGGADALAHQLIELVGRDVLLVEDVQWADAPSAALVERLAGEIRMIVTSRPTPAIAERLRDLCSQSALVELEPLDERSATELVRSSRPGLTDDEVESIVARSGGNLLALHELARFGAPSASWLLLARATLEALAPPDREAFDQLALLGRPIEPEVLGLGADRLVDQGLLSRHADGRVAPRHALWAEAAIALLPDEEHAARERALGSRLPDPGEAARHLLLGGDPAGATDAALRAAASATRRETRATHLRLAAEASADPTLAVDAAEALTEAHQYGAAADLLAGFDLDGDLLARAHWCATRRAAFAGDDNGTLAAVDAGLAAGPAEETELRLREERLHALLRMWNLTECTVEAARIRALQARVEPARPRTELVLARLDMITLERGWRDRLERVLQRDDHPLEVLEAFEILFVGLAFFHGPRTALTFLEQGQQRAAAEGFDDVRIKFLAILLYTRLLGLGDANGAVQMGEALLAEPLIRPARFHVLWPLGFAHAERGDQALGRRLLLEAEDIAPASSVNTTAMWWARAELELTAGHPRRAIAVCERLVAERPPLEPVVGPLADLTLAWARLAAEGRSGIDLGNVLFPLHRGAIPEAAALEALDRGDPEEATASFEEAAATWEGWNQRCRIRCLWAAGESARATGAVGRARELLATADDEVDRLGVRPAQALIRRSLGAVGDRRALPELRDTVDEGLSRTEADVLALVAQGHTSAGVADRLGLKPRTVDTMIGRAMTKLGARTRLEAAVLAAGPRDRRR